MNSFYTSNLLFILYLGCRSSAAHKCLNVKVPCQLELNIPKLIFYPSNWYISCAKFVSNLINFPAMEILNHEVTLGHF